MKDVDNTVPQTARGEMFEQPLERQGRLKNVQTFKALQHRNFALLWFGLILSNIGTWVQIIAQWLLVLAITNNSGAALGILSFAQALPFFIFALVGGGIADRVDKRNLLLVTQSLQIVFAFTLGALVLKGTIQLWHIFAIAALNCITLSFDAPTRFAFIPSLVPSEDLSNAISLNSAAFNGAQIIGPALGGALVVIIGYAGNFIFNGFSFVAVLIALLLMKLPKHVSANPHPMLRGIRDGLVYIRREHLLFSLLINYGSLAFFGATYTVLLSLFAVVILGETAAGTGVLYASLGLGTVIGALGLASLGDYAHKGRLLMVSSLLFSLSVIAVTFSRLFWLSVILLLVVGGTQVISSALTMTLLQLNAPRHMLGLVMSLNVLIWMGFRPLGVFPFGALANVVGVATSIALGAVIAGAISVYLFSSNKKLRDA